MCSAPSIPDFPKPEPLKMDPLPEPKPLPTPQQAPIPPVMAPQAQVNPTPAAPLPPQVNGVDMPAPPPVLVNSASTTGDAIIQKRRSKRQELQQASRGTDALRIPLQSGIGTLPTGTTGSTGLNIPV